MTARGRRVAMIALLLVAAYYAVKDSIGGRIYLIDSPYDAYMRVFAVSRLILVAIAALIARKKQLSASDELLFWGVLGLSLDVFWQYVPPGAGFWFSALLAQVAVGFGMAQLVRYAAEDDPDARSRRSAVIAAVAAGTCIALAGPAKIALAYGQIGGRMLDEATFVAIAPSLDRMRWLGMLAACIAIAVFAVASLKRATPRRRAHALLVLAAFAPLALATSAHALVRILTAHDNNLARGIDALGNVMTAAGLAYGALSRRLVDVEFYVSAALAAALAGAALTVLGFLGEHFFVPWVGEYVEHLPIVAAYGPLARIGAHLATAFLAYVAVTKVYDKTGPLVRNAIFHNREEHLNALRAFAETVTAMHASDVPSALSTAIVTHADAAYCALYQGRRRGFERIYGSGAPSSHGSISAADPRVPRSFAPHACADGSVSFAMAGGERISGFCLAGPKRDGTAYAPDELRAIGLACREAGVALGGGVPPSAHG